MNTVVALFMSGVLAQAPVSHPSAEAVVTAVRTQLEHGQYEEALRRAKERLDKGDLLEGDALELHKLAAVSAFTLKKKDEAEKQFTALLKLDPDYSLDPFVVPPPTVSFFEALRKKLDPSLQKSREERRERLSREEEARARSEAQAASEAALRAQDRRIEELSREVALKRTYRPFWVNLLPFGAGQFQQGRTRMGLTLAASEAALAAASVASFFAVESLVKKETVPVETEPGRTVDVTVRHVDEADRGKVDAWKTVRLTTGIGFYAVYLFGVIEAIGHHGRQTTSISGRSAPGGPSLEVAPYAVSGGGGVGMRSTF